MIFHIGVELAWAGLAWGRVGLESSWLGAELAWTDLAWAELVGVELVWGQLGLFPVIGLYVRFGGGANCFPRYLKWHFLCLRSLFSCLFTWWPRDSEIRKILLVLYKFVNESCTNGNGPLKFRGPVSTGPLGPPLIRPVTRNLTRLEKSQWTECTIS